MSAGPVLFVLPTLAVGGSERHVAALAESLAADGREVTVACLLAGGPLAPRLERAGVRVELCGLRRVTDPRAALRLLLLMARLRPAVVHAYLFGFDAVAAIPARILRVPLVLGSRREVAGWMRPRHLAVQAAGTALVDRVVCCSAAARAHALAAEREDGSRFLVIRNGVDLARFAASAERRASGRARYALAPAELAVVTVANLEREKGHELLLAAAREVVVREPRARFLWAGAGPLRARLGAAVAAAGLERRVTLLGQVDDVPTLLAAADLFALASLSEGLPNALLEAMAASLAVVAPAVGGVPEAVLPGAEAASAAGAGEPGGLLVAPGDPRALASALLELLADPARRARLGRAARARVEAEFGLERSLQAYRRLYAGS